jgi:hypothetical protein
MDQMIPQGLIDRFFAIVNNGDEEQARKFLLEHIKEFPDGSRNAIIAAFVEEAIAEKADGDSLIATLKSEGLEAANAMSAHKKELEKQAKLEEIKKSI